MNQNRLAPTTSRTPTSRASSWRKKALFSVATLLVFFGGAELLLWIVGAETVLEREDPLRGFSEGVAIFEVSGDRYRTARIKGPKTFNDQSFLVQKPTDGIRVFVLGGSSAYGFPWGGEAAFAAILGEALAEAHPDRHVEVVNVGGVSYAMHRIQIVVRELVRYEPDLVIVYSGHNEFVERDVQDALRKRGAALSRLNYVMSHSRLYSMLGLAKNRFEESEARRLDPVVQRDESRRFSLEEKEAAVRDYEEGLRNVVKWTREAGGQVLLSTVPANLLEWRPRQSSFARPLTEDEQLRWVQSLESAKARLAANDVNEAKQAIDRALALAPEHAETRYQSAEIHRARSEWEEAQRDYALACDLDASPVRVLSEVNEAIRRVAREENTLFVDSEALFQRLSPNGIVGLNLIEDYVHPTREGHEHIAWAMFTVLETTGWWGPPAEPSRETFEALVEGRASSVDERNSTWFFNQAYLLTNQGRIDEAIEKYREALRLSPTYAGAMANLAELLVEKGELQEARALSEALLERNPGNSRAHMIYGSVLFRENRPDEAIAELRKALEIDPDLLGAQLNLGKILVHQQAFAEAAIYLSQLLEVEPENPDALIALGQVNEADNLEEAERNYRDAIVASPDSVPARTRLAVLLSGQGQAAEADELFKVATALAKTPVESLTVANALIQARRFEPAVAVLEALARSETRPARVDSLLGYTLQQLRRPAEALVYLERAAARDPESQTAAVNVGAIQLVLGDGASAEQTFREVIATHGRSSKVLSNFGLALAIQGKWDEAIEALQEAVELDPDNASAKQRLQEALRRRPKRR